MPNPHDALFREVFAEPRDMEGLLRSALPRALARAIDWSTLAPVPGSFIDETLREHHGDLLFEARIGERPSLLYVLCEHKSQPDADTAFQLLRYVVRIWEAWRRKNPCGPLPPILPFVLHHGDRPWSGTRRLHGRIDLRGIPSGAARSLLRLMPDLGFVLDDLAAATEKQLEARAMSAIATMSVLFLQHARGRTPEDIGAAITRWQRIVEAALDGHGNERLLVLWSYLAVTTGEQLERVHAALPRLLADRIEEAMLTTPESLRQEGRDEGRAEGRTEGRAEMLLRLLAHRFGPVPAEVESRVRAATIPELDRWAEAVLDAASLDEVFADD